MTLWEPIVALFVMWRLVVRKLKIVMSTFWVNYIYKLETQFLPQICNFIFGVFKILASSFPPKLMRNLKFGHVVFFQNQFSFLRSFCATKALITTKIEDHSSQKGKKNIMPKLKWKFWSLRFTIWRRKQRQTNIIFEIF